MLALVALAAKAAATTLAVRPAVVPATASFSSAGIVAALPVVEEAGNII